MFLTFFNKKNIDVFGFFIEIKILEKNDKEVVFKNTFLCKNGLVFSSKNKGIDLTVIDFHDANSYENMSDSKSDMVIMEHKSTLLLDCVNNLNGEYILEINKFLINKKRIRCEQIKDFEMIVETEEVNDLFEGVFDEIIINKLVVGEDDIVSKLNLSPNSDLFSKNIFEIEIKNNCINII